MKHKGLVLLVISSLFITGCDKVKVCDECSNPPEALRLYIANKSDNSDYVASHAISKDAIHITYQKNEEKGEVVSELIYSQDLKKWLVTSSELSWLATQNVNTFYIKLGSAKVDTIFCELQKLKNNCCSYYNIKSVTVNKVALLRDSTGGFYTVLK